LPARGTDPGPTNRLDRTRGKVGAPTHGGDDLGGGRPRRPAGGAGRAPLGPPPPRAPPPPRRAPSPPGGGAAAPRGGVRGRRARGRLGDAALPDLRERVAHADRYLGLVATLEDIRIGRGTIGAAGYGTTGTNQKYREVFSAYGFDLDMLPAPVVAKRIADTPIRASLIAALDDWSTCTDQRAAVRQILEVARLADPDPDWGDRLRDLTTWPALAALKRLAETARIPEHSVSVLHLLSTRITAAGGDARALDRRIQQEYPGDFWANYWLGLELDKHHDPDAITYYTAAISIRPRTL